MLIILFEHFTKLHEQLICHKRLIYLPYHNRSKFSQSVAERAGTMKATECLLPRMQLLDMDKDE